MEVFLEKRESGRSGRLETFRRKPLDRVRRNQNLSIPARERWSIRWLWHIGIWVCDYISTRMHRILLCPEILSQIFFRTYQAAPLAVLGTPGVFIGKIQWKKSGVVHNLDGGVCVNDHLTECTGWQQHPTVSIYTQTTTISFSYLSLRPFCPTCLNLHWKGSQVGSTNAFLQLYVYTPIKGDDNVWADILPRWTVVTSIRRIVSIPDIMSSSDEYFDWQMAAEVFSIQEKFLTERLPNLCIENGAWNNTGNTTCVPDSASNLQLRRCVIAHTGPAGLRGRDATQMVLRLALFWTTIERDRDTFPRGCIHSLSTLVGKRVPPGYGPTVFDTTPKRCCS